MHLFLPDSATQTARDTSALAGARKNMITLHDIHKFYRTGDQSLHVLKGVDLHIREGELVSIMGSSGSGRGTLLNILGVLDGYDQGSYTLAGHQVSNLKETEAARLRNKLLG